MYRATLLAAAAIALGAPAAAHASNRLFTLAGEGADETHRVDGAPAAFAGLPDPAPVAGLPDGGFLVGATASVWRVHPQGRLHRVAGNADDEEGYTGDDGPALDAEVDVNHLAALPGGGFLIADGDDQRVRMVAPDGTITTVAGGGTSDADGIPALRAAIDRPIAVAALPGGGFVYDDGEEEVREVGPDGLVRTVADGGKDQRIHGERATAADFFAEDVAVAADGTLLIADGSHDTVDRVAADGTIGVAARPPRADETPELVTALPDGGFAFATNISTDTTDIVSRVYRVAPGGTPRRVAGGGPFAANAPLGLARRVDGGPATGLAVDSGTALSALPDGGLLLSYEPGVGELDGDVVTYIAPEAPAVLGVALRRDRDRVFTPGRANAVHVALTLPATVTLTAGGRSVTRALPAGQSTVPLPRRLSREAHGVTVTAVDAGGRRADDRTQVFPPGWLPTETAQLVGNAVLPDAETSDCRRFAGGRVDCMDGTEHDTCRAVSLRFAHGRLSWGVYQACRPRAHPRYTRGPRPLRSRDWHCDELEPRCRPALFGRLRELDIVPAA